MVAVASSARVVFFFGAGHNKSMRVKVVVGMALLLSWECWGGASSAREDGTFSGTVDHINEEAKLLRVRTTSLNAKYVGKGDRISLGDYGGMTECRGDVLARSKEHLLLKLPRFSLCSRNLPMVRGAWLKFYGHSLVDKVARGRKLVEILLKKRLALLGKLGEGDKDLKRHQEKMDVMNRKYGVLRDKVELEWRGALGILEGDRMRMLKKREEFEKRLTEVNRQLERYRVEDRVWELDRWSLDQRFYFKK